MPLKVRDDLGNWQTPILKVRDGASAWLQPSRGKVWNGTNWSTFYNNGGGSTITVNDDEQDDFSSDSGSPPTASFAFYSNGHYSSTTVAVGTGTDYDWTNEPEAADKFDIYVSLTSGSTPSGSALNTWLSLSSSRAWSVTDSNPLAGGAKGSLLAVQIRHSPTGTVKDTGNITITSTWSTGGGGGGGE
jgi:hypothetical protein